ncbi:hypothetical protein AAFF_G00379720 [Aldrovandia affinis]|uniref:ribonuclease H n=1 Tax=Aldrovandia affinis TaxID=143900 RepID=A0AAD7R489_9TELE|nr:hypothetical protein AAFF_G00379720 [Aldrovandia affinis]
MSLPLPSGSDLQRASATIMPAVKHGVDHFIATTGPPVHARARRLDPQKLAVAKAEFDSMERLGIVHDILVASVTSDEHQAHLRALFARLSEHGLIINLAKCQFGVPVVDFLGHRVTREAVRHFRFLLEGRTFTAFVDHKPLALAMDMVKEPWSARQQRQLAFVSEFTTDIQHVAGKDNVVADCLSRSIVDAVNLGVDYGQMAADQASDPEVQALRAATTGLQLQEVSLVLHAPHSFVMCPPGSPDRWCRWFGSGVFSRFYTTYPIRAARRRKNYCLEGLCGMA